MSKIIMITRSFTVCALLLMGVTSVSASEVTGTLSNGVPQTNSENNSEISGTLNSSLEPDTIGGTVTEGDSSTIGGTVTEDNSSSSGGGSRGGGGGSRSNEPTGTGQVLGLSTTNSPSFPNAGFNPDDGDDEEDYDIWETLMVLASIGGLMTLAVARYQKRVTS